MRTIARLPEGYDTKVSNGPEDGLPVSIKQRLAIARSLALSPEVLLMDEPCSALDPISSDTVEDLRKRLRGDYTLVVVTHNLAQARRIATNVGLMWVCEDAGKLIEFGTAEQFFDAPEHELTQAYVTGRRG